MKKLITTFTTLLALSANATSFVDGQLLTASQLNGAFAATVQNGTPAHAITLTSSGSSSVLTVPTTGTLATLAGSEALTNKSINAVSGLLLGNGVSAVSAYTGASCSNQFIRSLNASGAATCAVVGLTTDVTGVLPVANGGTNASSASGTALDNITGFSSTGFLTRTGSGTYAFQSATNGVTLANLAQIATNTVLGNSTSGTANVSALSVGSCSSSSSALTWTANSGFGCNTSIAASSATTATTATNATNTAVTDDTTTNASVYPTWVTTTTGNLPQNISSTKLVFNPSTGTLSTTVLSATTLTGSLGVANLSGAVSIANGGTNSASALSGSSIMVSNGSAIVQGAAGTATTVLHGNASGAPTYSAVSLTADVTGTLPIANGGTNDTGTAWTTYTPTITASSGTFTTVSGAGRYKTLGKTCFVEITITITTNGSAAVSIFAPLPFQAAAAAASLVGIDQTTAKTVNGFISPSGTSAQVFLYDGTYPGASSQTISISGVYETI